jgi:two-component system response regulator QseB
VSEKPKRILLVENDTELRTIFAEGLEDYGFEVVSARDGLSAFEKYVDQGPFDALVVEQNLPNVTGPELLQRLRDKGEGTPAILMSGRLEVGAQQKGPLGIASLFEKPFRLKALVTALRRVMLVF